MSTLRDAAEQAAAAEPAPQDPRGPLVLERQDLVVALAYWGTHGSGAEPGLRLTRQASKLVEVLATMDYFGQERVSLSRAGVPGMLVLESRCAAQHTGAPQFPERT